MSHARVADGDDPVRSDPLLDRVSTLRSGFGVLLDDPVQKLQRAGYLDRVEQLGHGVVEPALQPLCFLDEPTDRIFDTCAA